jgi:hypothetical protein
MTRVDIDQQSNEAFVDLAGFGDTKNSNYDLAAAFFNKKVLNSAKRLKIVLVESFDKMRIGARRSVFLTTIRQLAKLLDDQVELLSDSIALIGTKVDSSADDDDIISKMLAFTKATISSLQAKQIEAEGKNDQIEKLVLGRMIRLIQFANDASKVGIFRRPEQLGIPWEIPDLKKNFDRARRVIFSNIKYSGPLPGRFKVQ